MSSLKDFQDQWDQQKREAGHYRSGEADLGRGRSTQDRRPEQISRTTRSLPNIGRHRSPGMPSKRNKRSDVHRSHSGARTSHLNAMETRHWPEGQSATNTRDLVEDMPLAHNESITDPTMLDDSDFEIDKLPIVDSDDDESNETDIVMRNPFVDMKSGTPVEIVLIDRSKSKDSVRKVRIDEHLNVSYWNTDNKTKSIVVGIVIFGVVVLVTGLTVMFAGRNNVDHEQEYTMLVASMDRSAFRLQGVTPPEGWDVWQMKLPTPPGYINATHTLDDVMYDYGGGVPEPEDPPEVKSYTAFILVSEDHEERWMKARNSVILTFMKGSQVQIKTNIFKGQTLFSQETFYLGDTYIHGNSVYTTTYVVVPPDEDFTVYIKVTITADGYRVYSMIAIQSIEDMVSHLLTEDETKADIVSLPLSQPWTDEDNCEETIICQ